MNISVEPLRFCIKDTMIAIGIFELQFEIYDNRSIAEFWFHLPWIEVGSHSVKKLFSFRFLKIKPKDRRVAWDICIDFLIFYVRFGTHGVEGGNYAHFGVL